MCNSPNCSHDPFEGLDDDLGDIFGGEPLSAEDFAAGQDLARAQPVRVLSEETCPACNGSGKFRGYTGRILGDCFKCKGKGKRTFRTTLAQRERATELRNERKARDQRDIAEQAAGWLMANPDEATCLREAANRGFEFAQSMLDALHKYGHLTEKQEAAVRRMTEKSVARKAQWAAERAERDANKAEVQIDRIATALNTAKGSIKHPKMRLADFVFSLASATSANAGAVYVKSNEDVYLGKIMGGRFSRSRDCTAALEAAIIEAAADPEAAAVAYGKAYGRCSCCGRELTNPESIARSIGPICAERFGW